jgi:hypothetical protein
MDPNGKTKGGDFNSSWEAASAFDSAPSRDRGWREKAMRMLSAAQPMNIVSSQRRGRRRIACDGGRDPFPLALLLIGHRKESS